MATERVSVVIEADGQQAVQTFDQVAKALGAAGDGAESAKGGFAGLQSSLAETAQSLIQVAQGIEDASGLAQNLSAESLGAASGPDALSTDDGGAARMQQAMQDLTVQGLLALQSALNDAAVYTESQFNAALQDAEHGISETGQAADQMAQTMDRVSDAGNELWGLLGKTQRRILEGFGFNMNSAGNMLDSTAGNVNDALGTSLSGGAPSGGIGVFLDLLMKNPEFQQDVQKLMGLLEELITPLVDAIGPSLDALAPVMQELKPVFQLIGEALRLNLAPLVQELNLVSQAIHALEALLKPVEDALNALKDTIESFNPFGGGGGGGDLGLPDLNPGDGIPFLAEGGPVYAGRPYVVGDAGPELFVPNQSGQIVPNAQLNSGQQGGNTFTFNIAATDPRGSAQQIRQVIEELIVTKRLGLS